MSTEEKLQELLLRWEELRRRGETMSAADLCRTCPELADRLEKHIQDLQAVDALLHTVKPTDVVTATPLDTLKREAPASKVKTAQGEDLSQSVELTAGAEPVPGYKLVELLGEGGYGKVWKATAPGGFEVALKFVNLNREEVTVELRALEVIKAIRHPNLLSTFGAWQTQGFLIIAMELADRSLHDRYQEAVKQGLTGIPREELLEYFQEAAKGLDHLNEERHAFEGKERLGVQHRDVKPQNILLVGSGVKLADFGLARFLTHALTTHTGNLTPAYAAPEFLQGKTSSRSDQYCLAVTYCKLRGGRLPFAGSVEQILTGHLHGTPELDMLPEEERPALARALKKDPTERWPSCRAFVDALRKCVPADSQHVPEKVDDRREEGVPLSSAASVSPLEPLPSPRQRTSWAGTMAVVMLLLALIAIPIVLIIYGDREEDIKDGNFAAAKVPKGGNSDAQLSKDVLPKKKNAEDLPKKIGLVEPPPPPPELKKSEPKKPEPEIEKPEPKKLDPNAEKPEPKKVEPKKLDPKVEKQPPSPVIGELKRFEKHSGGVKSVAFLDMNLALSGGDDHTVRVWDLQTGKEVHLFEKHLGPVQSLAVSPAGRHVLSAADDKMIWLWPAETGQPGVLLKGHGNEIYSVAFSADGSHALSAGNDPLVRLWDVKNGKEVGRFEVPMDSVYSVAFSPNGNHALIAGDSGILRLWDVKTGKEVRQLVGHEHVVWSVAFSADGNLAVSAGGDSEKDQDYALRLWDMRTGRELTQFEKKHAGPVGSVAFSSDGQRALSGSVDKTVRLWDVGTGKELHCFEGHTDVVYSVAFSADGRRALSASKDGSVRLWGLPK